MTVQYDARLEKILTALRGVHGIAAIVLGGSRATRTHTATSDYDIGIYYRSAVELDIDALRNQATYLDDQHRTDVITPLGGWGLWINGGGWLSIDNHPVDFIYRDLTKVEGIIEGARDGCYTIEPTWGHPFGFMSTTYAAEVAACLPLFDPDDTISRFKAALTPYPALLRQRLMREMTAEADFMVMVAEHSVPRQDVNHLAGCIFRSVTCLCQAICAANETWVLNEKGILARAANLPVTIPDLAARTAMIYQRAVGSPEDAGYAIAVLADLVQDWRQRYVDAGFSMI